LDITCALINKYYSPAIKDANGGKEIAMKMREMWREGNTLKNRLEQNNHQTKIHWTKYDAAHFVFPSLIENEIRNLTFGKDQPLLFFTSSFFSGSYQIRTAKSYIRKHLRHSDINEEQMELLVELCK